MRRLRDDAAAAVALAVVAAGVVLPYRYLRDERAARVAALARLAAQQTLRSGAEARLAATAADRDSLRTAYARLAASAREVGGTLESGVRLHVAARDTVVVYRTLPTTAVQDSVGRMTRTATFRDSTFAGILRGTVTAPPCSAESCTPLGLTYQLHRPAFDPTVGFVRVGSGAAARRVAVVAWQGERVEVDAPFADVPAAEPRVVRSVELAADVAARDLARGRRAVTPTVRVGAELRLAAHLRAAADGTYRAAPGETPHLQVGVRRTF